MIYRGFTYRLHPTPKQNELFGQFAGVCRLIWNLALEQRRDHWLQYQRATGDNLNYVTQKRQLKDLRSEFDFIKSVSQDAEARVFADLDAAFKRFFKGAGGFPKVKRKGVHDSFSFTGREVRIEPISKRWARVLIPKIGWVKFRCDRQAEGTYTEAAIYRTALGWQISISCKIERDLPIIAGAVGIDRGVAVPLMLSDGTSYKLPASIEVLDRRHRRAQRVASRRKKGSARWARAMKRAREIKAKQTRIRKHWAHETTTDITRRFGVVVIERLRTKSMTKSAKGTKESPGTNVSQKRALNRAILNVGWHQIETMLTYKANRVIKVDPRHTSQICSACGCKDQLSRKSQAVFQCTSCGFSENADLNAAKNILSRGNTPALDVEGSRSYGPDEASTNDRINPVINHPVLAG